MRQADLEAKIFLLPSNQGGWKAPPRNPFRWHFHRAGEDHYAQFEISGVSHVRQGRTVIAHVSFLFRAFQREQLSTGTTFEIRDEQAIRGYGVVKKLLSLEQEK